MPRSPVAGSVLALCLVLPFTPRAALNWEGQSPARFLKVTPGQSAPAPHVGFAELPPTTTGITFTNHLRLPLMMANNNFMLGSGVAAGDFDGDGWCDLYFCAIDGTNALYRNLGNWRFADVTAEAGVGCAGWHSTGAIFADVNGDGRPDLLVATLGTGVHCFLNQGNGHFRESTAEAGLTAATGSTSLAMADVDGNGTLDLFVANYGAQALLRSGGMAPMKLVNGKWEVVGPYQGRLQLVNGRLEERGEPSVLYLNDGRGHFRAQPWNSDRFLDESGKPAPPPWDFSLTVQMRDINGDGFPDIYVCNDFQTPDRIWLNDGRGHFHALPRLAMRKQSFASMSVDFADIDRDGYLDFFVTEMRSRLHRLRMREVVGMHPAFPVPGRFDNRPEVVRNTLFRNRGDGTYAELANYSGVTASDWSWNSLFLDVDLDGFEDLLIANGNAFDVQDHDVLNYIRSLGRQLPEQAHTNLALYPPLFTPNVAFRNRHDLTFEDASHAWGFDSTRISQGMALADLDNDGDLDVIINCLNAPPLIYRNDATAPRLAVRLKGKPPNRFGIGAMIRVRGGPVPLQMQEILCGGRYLSGDEPERVFAAGTLTNRLTLEVRWPSGTTSTVRDAQANRIYEIQEPERPTPVTGQPLVPPPETTTSAAPWFEDASRLLDHVHHEPLFNDYSRQPLLMKQLSQLGPGAAWCDLAGDGQQELVLGTGKGGRLDCFRWNGRRFDPVPSGQAWRAPDDVTGLAAWCWADGRRALLAGLANYESGATNASPVLTCSLQRPDAAFDVAALQGLAPMGASPGPLAAADIDGAGQLALFVGGRVIPGAYPAPAASRVFRQQAGQLVPQPELNRLLEHVGLVSGAVWSDLDGDGYPELILACEWGPIRIFHNDHGRLSEWNPPVHMPATFPVPRPTLQDLTGWWNGVTTGDFDGDGRLDIIASNWGLNTGYAAGATEPLELYYGDFSGAGEVDLIEAYYAQDLKAMAPVRTRDALSRAFPQLLEAYPTHAAFSTATVPDLLRLLPSQPRRARATVLASMLFLNRGDHFVAVPLPTEAQLAPAFAANVGDADGDGHEDVFLSQNFFDMRPEWERADAGRGLWLRGDGTGRFTAVPGQISGVKVYGEQRGATLGDYDGDGRLDLLITQNGAQTKLYHNLGARPGLRVRLLGPTGNPDGIGAVIRLKFGNHFGPAREFHAGSGYWSQDNPVQVMGAPEPPAAIWVRWPGGKVVAGNLPPSASEVTVNFTGAIRIAR
ncbi:MAG: VCBS repeat-containing protein [Verrucomicrobia bacterium]|nr:VCBS repeat-containing protein [Verrucomicrobiota bacterium]